jgi:hypothetical protein
MDRATLCLKSEAEAVGAIARGRQAALLSATTKIHEHFKLDAHGICVTPRAGAFAGAHIIARFGIRAVAN